MSLRVLVLTALALVAFAANSILCRLSLKNALIDPVAFTQVRLLAGALVLTPILFRGRFPGLLGFKHWRPAAALFLYAIAFSLAYVAMDAGAGALILFACVQITMIGLAMVGGLRPKTREWIGIVVAFAGLVWLLAPGASAPPWASAAMMAIAGIAWGIYTVLGRGESDPQQATARNFLLAAPLALALFLAGPSWAAARWEGLALAAVSGGITSALGYIVWYAALRGLGAVQAAVVQVASPVLVALGGVLLLGEAFTLRVVAASVLILGGILLTMRAGQMRGAATLSPAPNRISR